MPNPDKLKSFAIFYNPVFPNNVNFMCANFYKYVSPNGVYGANRINGLHSGIDISIPDLNVPIYAAGDGTVIEVNYDDIQGNYITLAHNSNNYTFYTRYLHLNNISSLLFNGISVKGGITVLGNMGSTGAVTAQCLHFEIRKNESPLLNDLNSSLIDYTFNPANYIPGFSNIC
jgi:murein DD-endopeptidase MepM/ murein hydrolase activator NlpD